MFYSLDIWHKSKKARKVLAKVWVSLFAKCDTNTPMRLQAGKIKNMNKLQLWSGNIISHFLDCCKTCEGEPVKLKVLLCVTITLAISSNYIDKVVLCSAACAKCTWMEYWNLRSWATGRTVQWCLNGNKLQYFSWYEAAFKGMQKLVMDQQWLKSMKYYLNFWSVLYCFVYYMVLLLFYRQTCRLESFHNVLMAYAPKCSAF